MIKGKPVQLTKTRHYVDLLERRERFAVARYGDGEWGAILGRAKSTCYGDRITPLLGGWIAHTLIDAHQKPYHYASCPEPWSQDVSDWCVANGVRCRWAKKSTLEASVRDGTFADILRALRDRDVAIAGLPRLKPLGQLFGYQHIVVDGPNAHIRWEVVMVEIIDFVNESGSDVLLLACGLASVLLAHALFPVLPELTIIDVGSIFDPFVGFESRRGHRSDWHRKMVRRVMGESRDA